MFALTLAVALARFREDSATANVRALDALLEAAPDLTSLADGAYGAARVWREGPFLRVQVGVGYAPRQLAHDGVSWFYGTGHHSPVYYRLEADNPRTAKLWAHDAPNEWAAFEAARDSGARGEDLAPLHHAAKIRADDALINRALFAYRDTHGVDVGTGDGPLETAARRFFGHISQVRNWRPSRFRSNTAAAWWYFTSDSWALLPGLAVELLAALGLDVYGEPLAA